MQIFRISKGVLVRVTGSDNIFNDFSVKFRLILLGYLTPFSDKALLPQPYCRVLQISEPENATLSLKVKFLVRHSYQIA